VTIAHAIRTLKRARRQSRARVQGSRNHSGSLWRWLRRGDAPWGRSAHHLHLPNRSAL